MDLGVRVTHVFYPNAPLYVCACVFMCVCGMGLSSFWCQWWRLHLFGFGEELRISTACFRQHLSSPLHTHPNVSNFQSLTLHAVSDLAFLFYSLFEFLMITHACLKACPSAFCQATTCLWNLCVLHTACWISWCAVMNEHFTCRVSAMLRSLVMTSDSSCHPTWNDASMIQLIQQTLSLWLEI